MPLAVRPIWVGIPDPDPESASGEGCIPVPGLEIALAAAGIPVPGLEIAPGAAGSPVLALGEIGAEGNYVPDFDKSLVVGRIPDPDPGKVGEGGSHDPGPDRGQGDAQPIEASEGEVS